MGIQNGSEIPRAQRMRPQPRSEDFYVHSGIRAAVAALVRIGTDRAGAVHGHHGHLDHRGGAAGNAGVPGLFAGGSVLGLQRLRHRLRRPAAARRAPVRHLGCSPHLPDGLGGAGRRVAGGRTRRIARGRADRPGCAGCGRRADRPLGTDTADDGVRVESQGADHRLRVLRRRRPGGRHRRRIPRRAHHRVRLVAVGLLHQHPDRRPGRRRGRGAGSRGGRPRPAVRSTCSVP